MADDTRGESDLARLSSARADEFVTAVAPLFEGAPGFLYRLAAARPFDSAERLFERAREIAHQMPEPLQVELIDAHPRLGAAPGSVSRLSFVEQGYDRAPAPDSGADEGAELDRSRIAGNERSPIAADLERLNAAYEERFGFRYCVFVAGRTHAVLVPEMAAALARERDSELHRALDAVVDIARDRLRKSGTVSA